MDVNNLPDVVTWQHSTREWNLKPLSSKSNTLTTRLPTYQAMSFIVTACILVTERCNLFYPQYQFIICPIAIAYSMGSDYQLSLSLSQHVSLCLCISWLIFAKSDTEVTTPESKERVCWGQHCTTPSPILPPYRHFGPKSPENPCKHKYANFCLKSLWIAGIPMSYT